MARRVGSARAERRRMSGSTVAGRGVRGMGRSISSRIDIDKPLEVGHIDISRYTTAPRRTRDMLNDNGIAWMIAGGLRDETRDDQRQLQHRLALADGTSSRPDALRRRIAAIVGGRAMPGAVPTLSADCCAA